MSEKSNEIKTEVESIEKDIPKGNCIFLGMTLIAIVTSSLVLFKFVREYRGEAFLWSLLLLVGCLAEIYVFYYSIKNIFSRIFPLLPSMSDEEKFLNVKYLSAIKFMGRYFMTLVLVYLILGETFYVGLAPFILIAMLVIPMFKGRHEFVDPESQPMPELAPMWVGYTCVHCHQRSGLDGWQIRDMPKSMILCLNGKKMSILSVLITGSFDCMHE